MAQNCVIRCLYLPLVFLASAEIPSSPAAGAAALEPLGSSRGTVNTGLAAASVGVAVGAVGISVGAAES